MSSAVLSGASQGEYISHPKAPTNKTAKTKKTQKSNPNDSPPPTQENLSQEGETYELPHTSTTEGQWELDDSQDELNSQTAPAPKEKDKEMESRDPKRIMNAFMERHGVLLPTYVPGSRIRFLLFLHRED